jgi:hypothetical protein
LWVAAYRQGQFMTATPTHAEPRVIAGELIGRLILAFGDMEHQVGLSLGYLAATPEFTIFEPIVDSMALKQKLAILHDMVGEHLADKPACLEEFARWHGPMRRLRLRHHRLIHGRWDSEINAFRPGRVRRNVAPVWDLAELREECRRTEALRETLGGWRERWLG